MEERDGRRTKPRRPRPHRQIRCDAYGRAVVSHPVRECKPAPIDTRPHLRLPAISSAGRSSSGGMTAPARGRSIRAPPEPLRRKSQRAGPREFGVVLIIDSNEAARSAAARTRAASRTRRPAGNASKRDEENGCDNSVNTGASAVVPDPSSVDLPPREIALERRGTVVENRMEC